jgi:hypothetical protein
MSDNDVFVEPELLALATTRAVAPELDKSMVDVDRMRAEGSKFN